MAAEVIARELRLNLVVVDLSQVVSKYIGETGKNLHRVFDAAEDGAAVLLFDEADTLFGKRTEVRDSHDRYANLGAGSGAVTADDVATATRWELAKSGRSPVPSDRNVKGTQ